jgi:Mg-chelatase subunit ChlD
MLFVDTSDGTSAALNHIRAGLLAFLDAVPPDAEVMLISTGRQVRVRIQPTTDRKKLKDVAGGLFSDGGATPLIDALLEMDDRFVRKSPDRWPVFVIITGDGSESSEPAHEKQFNTWLRDLPARGISAHAFALKYKGGGLPDTIASHVVQTVDGRFDFMNTSNALPEKLRALGEHLANDAKAMAQWYQVDFQSDSDGSRPVEIGVSRDAVAVKISYRRQQTP